MKLGEYSGHGLMEQPGMARNGYPAATRDRPRHPGTHFGHGNGRERTGTAARVARPQASSSIRGDSDSGLIFHLLPTRNFICYRLGRYCWLMAVVGEQREPFRAVPSRSRARGESLVVKVIPSGPRKPVPDHSWPFPVRIVLPSQLYFLSVTKSDSEPRSSLERIIMADQM